jgi:sugar phosphate permease
MAIIPRPLAPWKNIYIFSGTLTIVWGIVCYFIMPDSPLDAKFFNDCERYVAIERIRKNNTGVTNHHIKWSQVREAFMDPQVYLLMLMSFCTTTPNGAVSTLGPILVKNMGFTSNLINLCLQVPTGFVGMTAVLVATFLARKYNGIRLYLAMLFSCVVMAGSLILWLAHRNQTAVLMVGYCMTQFMALNYLYI